MSEQRCDLHGPYTPEQAAALVLGFKVPETGYVCDPCRAAIKVAAQSLADTIDARIAERVYAESVTDATGRIIAPPQPEPATRPAGPWDANERQR
jgi:hypothetical protein